MGRSSHRRCSVKVLVKLSLNSQENACVGVSIFIKLQALDPRATASGWYMERDDTEYLISKAQVFRCYYHNE